MDSSRGPGGPASFVSATHRNLVPYFRRAEIRNFRFSRHENRNFRFSEKPKSGNSDFQKFRFSEKAEIRNFRFSKPDFFANTRISNKSKSGFSDFRAYRRYYRQLYRNVGAMWARISPAYHDRASDFGHSQIQGVLPPDHDPHAGSREKSGEDLGGPVGSRCAPGGPLGPMPGGPITRVPRDS